MINLHYPTLDVFFYELRASLGDDDTKIQQHAESFMRHCGLCAEDTELKRIFLKQNQSHGEHNDVDLFGDKQIKAFSQDNRYQGYYYPQRLNDVYALLVDCSIENSETEPCTTDDLSWLQGLKDIVQAKLGDYESQKIIGATWMLSFAIPAAIETKHYDKIAASCCQKLLPEISCQQSVVGKGEFLNGYLFEYWHYDPSTEERHHLIIGIYPDKNTIETLAAYYDEFINLFHYRHKILWAYRQSVDLKQSLIAAIPEVRRCRKEVKTVSGAEFNIPEVERTLAIAREKQFDYAEELRLLIDQKHTIDINLHNYQQRLQRIRQKSEAQLISLDDIAKLAENRYSLQIQKDYDNLSPELDLLDKLVMHIHVSIGLQKEQRDRKFIQRIEIFGLVFALGAIIVATSGNFPINSPDDALNHPIGNFLFEYLYIPKEWLKASILITLSIIGAIVLTSLILLLLYTFRTLKTVTMAIFKKMFGK
ncbi:hypothetical protein [Candidatus Parabeggiatoa sp. HSG14]|uniref:hypothetical protein n=1 Tax=Candidatus Parabeggiatoa sp. HSG14 TaxID=3055593 RepID=UPI0025A85CBE|nr:hypothetical protein [Thiotrichales bacterium HSG14]